MDDQRTLPLLDARSKARTIKCQYGLKLLMVDYLHLMSGDGDPRKNRNQQIEEISDRAIPALAYQLNEIRMKYAQLTRTYFIFASICDV